MAQSSNWLMSTTAKKLIADVESLCTTTGGETKRLIIGKYFPEIHYIHIT